jgi:pimeloyl-ACP methyl ester carboxylesterase
VVAPDGVGLSVREAGVGVGAGGAPTVVLVHGYPDDAAMWEPVAEPLAARFHVVAYDTRGAGVSDAPKRTAGYRLERLVDDLAAVVDATSPDRPVHLVGHDWGSVQGWEGRGHRAPVRPRRQLHLAVRTLPRSRRLVDPRAPLVPGATCDPPAGGPGRALRWYIGAFHLPGAPLFWRLGGGRLVHRSLVGLGELPADDAPSPTLGRQGANGVRLYRANVARRMGRPHVRRTDLPVQLVVAAGDRFLTPTLIEDVERWAPDVRRRVVPGGHWLPRLAPGQVAGWIADLVDEVEAPVEKTPRPQPTEVAP